MNRLFATLTPLLLIGLLLVPGLDLEAKKGKKSPVRGSGFSVTLPDRTDRGCREG